MLPVQFRKESFNPFHQLWNRFFFTQDRKLPTEINELTAQQLTAWCLHDAEKKSIAESDILLLDKILNLPPWVIRNLSAEQVDVFTGKLKFLHEDFMLTKILFRNFKAAGEIYYGPSDCFYNICFGEYIDVLRYLRQYNEEKNDFFLNALIAILWRPSKKNADDGDIREKYNPAQLPARAAIFKKFRREVKTALLLQISGCLRFMQQENAAAFESSKSGDDNDPEELLLAMAGTKFGDYEKTFYEPAWRILKELKRIARVNTKKDVN